ncbi:hypothetical protein Tco_0157459, partial [Tanacetum coccineum]
LPKRKSTRLTPPAPVPTTDKADEMILQETLQVSLADHKSREEQEGWWKDQRMLLMIVYTLGMMNKIFSALEEEEITDEVYELKRREKGKIVEESRSTPSPTPIRSPRIHTDLVSSDTEKLQELTETDTTPSSSSLNIKSYKDEVMVESLPTMVDKHIKEQVEKQVPEQERRRLQAEISSQIQQAIDNHIPSLVDKSVPQTTCRTYVVRLRDQDDPHDDDPPEGENSAKRQKTSKYEAYVTGESSGQVNESEQSPSSSGNQEQVDDYDFWTELYALDNDEIPTKQVSQDIMEEVSLTINEAELKKIADEMLRQRCTSGDEHQYHIDQMKNLFKSDIVWESIKEILASSHPQKITPLVQSFIKTYWELGHEHKFIIEIVARRANECIVLITESDYKNLNKNDIEDIYLLIMNDKVPNYAETGLLWSLSVFVRSLVIWERVHDFQLGIESYQQKVNLTAPTISFLGIKKHKMVSIIYEPVHGIIYKDRKKEKRVMRHSKIHKFYDATLNIVLEGLKSYNNDVKYGYKQRDLTEDEVEYLKLSKEEIEVRLKYRNQMRRWEMYVNGRPLGPRRECPE